MAHWQHREEPEWNEYTRKLDEKALRTAEKETNTNTGQDCP